MLEVFEWKNLPALISQKYIRVYYVLSIILRNTISKINHLSQVTALMDIIFHNFTEMINNNLENKFWAMRLYN
jgi:hypothetical protein